MDKRRPAEAEFVLFFTFMATALTMGAALAHAFELPNKMLLSKNDYFIVQSIYRGWDQLAYLLGAELIGLLSLLFLTRGEPHTRRYIILALVGLTLAQAVFWIFTFPANQATANWTVQPDNWETLRRQWEYSHLAGAVFQTLALAALALAMLSRCRSPV